MKMWGFLNSVAGRGKSQIFSKFTVPGLVTLAVQWLGLVASTALVEEPSGMVGEASGMDKKKKSYRKFSVPNRPCPGICVPHKLYWNPRWEWATEFSWLSAK